MSEDVGAKIISGKARARESKNDEGVVNTAYALKQLVLTTHSLLLGKYVNENCIDCTHALHQQLRLFQTKFYKFIIENFSTNTATATQ